MAPSRYRILPEQGQLLVSADLHGNYEDFRALQEIFWRLREEREDTHWLLLGDLVHGPDHRSSQEEPSLYGFPDRSWTIVRELRELQRQLPDRIHVLLGNHDHGHVGGSHTSKFFPDEVAHLEANLMDPEREALQTFFAGALLVALAPCGVLFAHGSPGLQLENLRQLQDLTLDTSCCSLEQATLLKTILTSYGQKEEVTDRLLRQLSESSGLELGLVVHGHDRDEEGWFVDGTNQLCPVIFGAPRQNKRYLLLDLSARYRNAQDVREDRELLRLYGSPASAG